MDKDKSWNTTFIDVKTEIKERTRLNVERSWIKETQKKWQTEESKLILIYTHIIMHIPNRKKADSGRKWFQKAAVKKGWSSKPSGNSISGIYPRWLVIAAISMWNGLTIKSMIWNWPKVEISAVLLAQSRKEGTWEREQCVLVRTKGQLFDH